MTKISLSVSGEPGAGARSLSVASVAGASVAVGAAPDPGVDAVRSGSVTPDGSSEPQAASAAVRASARTTLNRVMSTVGLVIDVTAVLTLILLSHAESGMARIVGTDEGIFRGLVLRVKSMMKHNKTLLVLNVVCVVGLFVGTGLLILGIWCER